MAAREAATAWLHLPDHDEWEGTWQEAAPLLRRMTGSPAASREFIDMARERYALPKDAERRLVQSEYDPTPPGAPPGTYVRFAFARVGVAQPVIETVVVQETDTGWRVAMYGVGPG